MTNSLPAQVCNGATKHANPRSERNVDGIIDALILCSAVLLYERITWHCSNFSATVLWDWVTYIRYSALDAMEPTCGFKKLKIE